MPTSSQKDTSPADDEKKQRDLTDKVFTEQRNEAMIETVKGLLFMNGGASVALLAFLHTTWERHQSLSKFIFFGILFMVVGIFLAGCVNFFRYHASEAFQMSLKGVVTAGPRFKNYRSWYLKSAYLSLVSFLAGMLIVLWGVWKELDRLSGTVLILPPM